MEFSVINEIIVVVSVGIVQGISEFLPISSTAHLRIFSQILVGADIGLATSNFIQFGTLLAIIRFYWKDLSRYTARIFFLLKYPDQISMAIRHTQNWLQSSHAQTKLDSHTSAEASVDTEIAQVAIATIPVIITALFFRPLIELLRQDISNIAWFLLAGAVLIFVAEVVHDVRFRQAQTNTSQAVSTFSLSIFNVLLIGFFQSLSVFPGMSRSGSTLAGALFIGKDRAASVRFSFLLSIPALGLAGIYDGIQLIQSFIAGEFGVFPSASSWVGIEVNFSVISLLVGFVVAFFVGYACLEWLLTFLARSNSGVFIVYRILLAAGIFAVVITGLLAG